MLTGMQKAALVVAAMPLALLARVARAQTSPAPEIQVLVMQGDLAPGEPLAHFDYLHVPHIDGAGNRVSAMIYGPTKVIVVVGANKIVKDVDAAIERIHSVAAPLNARRHQLKHHANDFGELPCVRTGVCVDCNHPWRICRYTVIIEGQMGQKGRFNVVLVGEELGL